MNLIDIERIFDNSKLSRSKVESRELNKQGECSVKSLLEQKSLTNNVFTFIEGTLEDDFGCKSGLVVASKVINQSINIDKSMAVEFFGYYCALVHRISKGYVRDLIKIFSEEELDSLTKGIITKLRSIPESNLINTEFKLKHRPVEIIGKDITKAEKDLSEVRFKIDAMLSEMNKH